MVWESQHRPAVPKRQSPLFGCSRASLYVRQYDRSHTASLPGCNAGPGRDVATAVPQGTYPLIAHFPTGTVYATHHGPTVYRDSLASAWLQQQWRGPPVSE